MSGVVQVVTAFNAAVTALPAVLELIQSLHAHQNPDAPPLTKEQAAALLQEAVAQSLAKDAQLRGGASIASAADLGVSTGSTGE